jgi:hypothetical protein
MIDGIGTMAYTTRRPANAQPFRVSMDLSPTTDYLCVRRARARDLGRHQRIGEHGNVGV